ncbi:MAG TPA: ester cyclase [Chloroflexota bacterium]|nr:ester cyclase [Chloroflexota bacterium]
MSLEANKELIRRLVADGWGKGDQATVDALLAPTFVDHAAELGGGASDAAGFKEQVREFRAAFPDGKTQIDDLIAEGDKVVLRWTDGGTHRGPFMGVAPTGKRVTLTGIDIYRIADGKIVEYWCSEDVLGLLEQLGAVQPPR